MSIPISIELTLVTPTGPAGPRLRRAVDLPVTRFSFPDTPEGRTEAETAKEALQNYVNKYIIPKHQTK